MLYCIITVVFGVVSALQEFNEVATVELDMLFFECEERTFVIQDSDFMENLLHYLDTTIQYFDSDMPYRDSISCLNVDFYHGKVFDDKAIINEDFKLAIYNGNGTTRAKPVYIYAHNYDNTSLYKLWNSNIVTSGCMNLKQDASEGSITFNYTHVSVVQSWLNRSNRDLDGICQDYTEFLKSNKRVYSPYHGSPVIFVPGLVSSSLFGQSTEESKSSYAKYGKQLWLKLSTALLGVAADKLLGLSGTVNHWKLYINESGYASNFDNIYADAAYWGDPEAVRAFGLIMFGGLTSAMLNWGYAPGLSIAAAPYDFRLTPYENEEFFDRLETLVKTTFNLNNKKKVVLLGHSMGCLYIWHFLQRHSQKWIDKYVKSFVSIGAPWGGSSLAAKFLLRGEILQASLVRQSLIKLGQSWLSTLYLLPNANAFSRHFHIVRTPSKNYTIADYEAMLLDLELNNSVLAYQRIKHIVPDMSPPKVETYCVYGDGLETENSYVYMDDDAFPDGDGLESNVVPGDGVVSTESARACMKWHGRQLDPVHEKSFQNVKHYFLLNEPEIFDFVRDVIFS